MSGNFQECAADWLDQYIWPQIHNMMLNDAYFKLMGCARELTGEFSGPIANLIEVGYVTSQTLAIRRFCDGRRDVISLRRLLVEAKANGLVPAVHIDHILPKLDCCEHICRIVNDYLAHTANRLRKPNVSDWNLQLGHLTGAQKAICEVAVTIDRDFLRRRNNVRIIPVPQFDIMQEFRPWVAADGIKKLLEFWRAHNDTVNGWIDTNTERLAADGPSIWAVKDDPSWFENLEDRTAQEVQRCLRELRGEATP